ncbi:hypothetical protein NSS79_26050 [Paenibacillus sp. FSL L8-0436]|uniref:hypothetical protein n=1 Tax=Paenibacillus sp. FSL L8-0436 TaxID=2954686 RepID=UPI003158AA5C
MAEINDYNKLVAKDFTISALNKIDPKKFEKLNIDEIISTYTGIYNSFLAAIETDKPEELKSYARESRQLLNRN